ncbi:RDD family protein [Fimbriimonas ginsengisoli]|uniref:RDD domain containing protein n=1 Tax=Fimbriimonas ginsengisoli Gsoil 348 TaxID=661478 RepID=A0A068NNZ4_FIMGI|nr:RDD family protein [Fimbriimonas ginsengisoli]AIE85156.1 RDD domain containing protein [Fimbriimonas ginsengisoli Gsoil 348]
MDQDLAILTPEKTILTYRLAGLGSRVGAHVVDLMLCVAGMSGLGIGIGLLLSNIDQGLAVGVVFAVLGAFPFLYFILFEGLWNGQTLGKRFAGIRVRMADGTPITFVAAVGRNLMRPADMIPGPYFLGLIAMFTNPRSQRIGDQIAGTVVCYERRPHAIFAAAPHVVGIHPWEPQIGDLPGMTPQEYDALKRFCDRFPELSTATQNKLIEEVWRPLAERRRVPAIPDVHPLYLAEATVMKYGRQHGLL